MGKKKRLTIDKRGHKSDSGSYELILGKVNNRPAYAIAYNNSKDEFQGLYACGWICEDCGEPHWTDQPALELTESQFNVLRSNIRCIVENWLMEGDWQNKSAVEAAYDYASRLHQLLYTDDADMPVH